MYELKLNYLISFLRAGQFFQHDLYVRTVTVRVRFVEKPKEGRYVADFKLFQDLKILIVISVVIH